MTTSDIDAREAAVAAREAKLDGQVITETGEPDTEIAKPSDVWPHETVDLYGETWQVRAPHVQALTAVALASGKFVPQDRQNAIVGGFLVKHLSEQSYMRLMERLSDPDDPDFTPQSLGILMKTVANLAKAPDGPA